MRSVLGRDSSRRSKKSITRFRLQKEVHTTGRTWYPFARAVMRGSMQREGTDGTEGKVKAMSKLKTILVVAAIILIGLVNVYLGMLDAKLDYEMILRSQNHSQSKVLVYDLNDPTTWWYEGHS